MANAQGLVIEGSAIEALMVKAILEAWTPEQRDALIHDAIATLFTKTYSVSRLGGEKATVIEVALAKGAEKAAINVVADMMATDEYRDRLETIIKEEFEKLIKDPENEKGVIRQGIAAGLTKHLTKSGY